MDSSVEDRLVALESRAAHYEKMADELSEVVTEQSRTIDLLRQQVRRLGNRVRELEPGWERSPQDDKPPPHY